MRDFWGKLWQRKCKTLMDLALASWWCPGHSSGASPEPGLLDGRGTCVGMGSILMRDMTRAPCAQKHAMAREPHTAASELDLTQTETTVSP